LPYRGLSVEIVVETLSRTHKLADAETGVHCFLNANARKGSTILSSV